MMGLGTRSEGDRGIVILKRAVHLAPRTSSNNQQVKGTPGTGVSQHCQLS